MHSINIHEAKTHLSRLLEAVSQGEEIVIAKAGKPIARLVPYRAPPLSSRIPGGWEEKIWRAADFDALDTEIAYMFQQDE